MMILNTIRLFIHSFISSLHWVMGGIIYCFLVLLTFSCQKADPEKEAESVKRSYEAYLPEVTVTKLERQDFNKEVLSNGTLQAFRKAEIRSEVAGVITAVNIANGQRVTAGSRLVSLDDSEASQNLKRSQVSLDQAAIELEDQLINHQFDFDTTTMNQEVLRNLKIKSGYSTALLDLQEARHELSKTRINAPFPGRVADLDVKVYNHVSAGDEICKLIDDSKFEVVFPVIESEIALLQKGQAVQVSPYAINASYNGTITAINPLVDENGLIQVKALIDNSDGKLIEGLNVRVAIRQEVEGQLVIPKEALLQRDGRQVVFTLMEDSTAYWNYVEVGFENADSYTVTDGLEENQLIIIEGNINLAHESKVIQKGSVGSGSSTQTAP
ncbi:MAG: efflux RND transporter periplasmic adaptor subunit [Cyclobacteriaceae bacterium]